MVARNMISAHDHSITLWHFRSTAVQSSTLITMFPTLDHYTWRLNVKEIIGMIIYRLVTFNTFGTSLKYENSTFLPNKKVRLISFWIVCKSDARVEFWNQVWIHLRFSAKISEDILDDRSKIYCISCWWRLVDFCVDDCVAVEYEAIE